MSETKPTTKKTPVPKHIADKRVTIRVANTDIHIGESYEVIGKKDMDAPSGFIEHNTTKLLMAGIKEDRCVVYDEDMEKFDTGFDLDSPCNRKMSASERVALVKKYNELIKEPYERAYNKNVSSVNEKFWAGDKEDGKPYIYTIYTKKSFDTSRIKDLFDLFHALKQGKICEVGEKDSDLQRANYCIKNKTKIISLQEERENDKFEAIGTFSTLLATVDADKDDSLYTILEWMQITNIRGADKETLKRTVLKMFANEKTGYDSCKRFIEAFKLTDTEKGKEKMEIFSMLSKLNIKRKLEFKRNQYYLEDELLGNHLKGAAELALQKSEIRELIIAAYEKYCT